MITVPLTTELLRGHLEIETTERGVLPHRLPTRVRAQLPDPQLQMAESQPSGVRLALRTTATRLEVDAVPTRHMYKGLPPRPEGVWDLVVDGTLVTQATVGGGDLVIMDPRGGAPELVREPAGTLLFELPPGDKTIELWLPTHERTELAALRADAPVEPAPRDRRTWLHHGSSISQGSNATSPTTTWAGRSALAGGVDLVNLGFGGSMLLDAPVARAMRETPADLISLEVGINLVNGDVMRLRAFTAALHGFLDTVREGHPGVPVLVISSIHCAIHEATPGPGVFDAAAAAEGRMAFLASGDPAEVGAGRLTLQTIRAEIARVVAQRRTEDPDLQVMDGLDLFGAADEAELPYADNLHPGPEAHARIAERFTARAFSDGGPFGAR